MILESLARLSRSANADARPIPIPPALDDAERSAAERAWYRNAPRLAAWTLAGLVVRADVYGGYYLDRADGQVKQLTRWAVPNPDRPDGRLAPPLDLALLEHHYRGWSGTPGVVGLHVACPAGRCAWVVVDIDAHGPDDDIAGNLRMAGSIVEALVAMGLTFLVEDSDGKGGIHIWVMFGRPVPQSWAFRFGRFLVRDWAMHGLIKPPESFPKAAAHSGKGCGNWVRLPGHRHKGDHHSRMWSPASGSWLDPEGSIEAILATRGDATVGIDYLVPAGFTAEAGRARPRPGPPRPGPKPDGEGFPRTVRGESAPAARARSALHHLLVVHPNLADDYDDWLRVGMCLTGLDDDAGLVIFDDFSLTVVDKYPGFEALAAKWATIQAPPLDLGGRRPLGVASLFAWAAEEGWDRSFDVTPRRRRRPAATSAPKGSDQ